MSRKKIASMILAATLSLGLLAGCGAAQQTSNQAATEMKLFRGVGQVPSFRVGPGKDDKGVQVYSINYVTSSAIFDKDGKIVDVYFDTLEVSTPNYDGAGMPHFSGWPGTAGYNVTDHETAKVTGVSTNNDETITAEVTGWKTKRERGNEYGMNMGNDWYKQANYFQDFFKGKTVAEIEEWFAKSCSDVNGRPLKAESKNEEDKAKYAKLTEDEKKVLADVVSGATMSIKDAHGDMLGALKLAYENSKEFTVPAK